MKKISVFLLVLFSWIGVNAQQNPVVASQPYKFMKWVSIADSLILNNPKLGTYTGHLTFKPNGTVGLDTVKYATGTITFSTDFTYISGIVGMNFDTMFNQKQNFFFKSNGFQTKFDSLQATSIRLTRLGLGNSTGDGLRLENTQASTNTTDQSSPGIFLNGTSWASLPLASQTVKFRIWNNTVVGSLGGQGSFRIDESVNGNTFNNIFRISQSGISTFAQSINESSGNLTKTGLTDAVAGIGYNDQNSANISATNNNDVLAGYYGNVTYTDGGKLLTVGTITSDASHTNGTYTNVLLTDGTTAHTVNALATVVVSGGAVTSITPTTGGSRYVIGSVLTISSGSIGGTGTAVTCQVATIGNYTGVKHRQFYGLDTSESVQFQVSGFARLPNDVLTVKDSAIYKGNFIQNNPSSVQAGANFNIDGTGTMGEGVVNDFLTVINGASIGNGITGGTLIQPLDIQMGGSSTPMATFITPGELILSNSVSTIAYSYQQNIQNSEISIYGSKQLDTTSFLPIIFHTKAQILQPPVSGNDITNKTYVDSHSGTGTVTAVSGTTNRITSTGGTTPIIDISASYVGQTSITTLGTISTGSIPYSLITGTPTLPTGATPTALIGFTAVAGSATSFTRSDGAAKADSTIIRSVANSYSLSGLQTKLNLYLPLTGGTLTGPLGITSATTPQITITNGSGTAIFSEASGGNLTITPSGSTTITGSATVTGTLGVNSFMSSSTSSNLYVPSAVSAVSTSASQWEFIPSTSNFLRVGVGGNNSTTLTAGQTYSSFLLNGMGVTSVATGTANPWIVGAAVLAPVITNGGVAPTNGTALYIGGATSNAANNYALYSASGTNFFGGTATNTQALAASATADGYDLVNSTIAVTGSNVYNSPFLHYTVQGFASTPAASRSIDAEVSIASAQGTANPTGQMSTQWLINGSAAVGIWTMTSAGVNVFTGGQMTNKIFNTAANNVDGIINLTTTASTSGTTSNWAPTFTLTGTVWNTTATAASNVMSMRMGLQGVSGITPSEIATWSFGNGVSTPTYASPVMTLTNAGVLNLSSLTASMGVGTDASKNLISINVPITQGTADLTAQSTAGNVTTFTVGASTATFNVSGYINITAVTVDVIEMQVTYTDENSTSQTANFFTQGATSALLSSIGNSVYPPMTIRAKNGTVITVKTTLTTGTGSIAYDTGSRIQQL